MVLSGVTDVKVGTTGISKIYRGTVLEWEKERGPEWPYPFYYPDLNFVFEYGRGIGYWLRTLNSEKFIPFDSDDCEGEGGDTYFVSQSKSQLSPIVVTETTTGYKITSEFSGNNWLMPYSHYEAQYNRLPNFWNSCYALCYRQRSGHCGSLIRFPSDADLSNIQLLVDISPTTEYGEGISFGQLVQMCPNLQYIALHKDGTNTGQTFTLTGSTAWTADSMKFTEWYCPGTTFIIENNSWWRSRIDWEIAAERNITFKDSNGNIITQ